MAKSLAARIGGALWLATACALVLALLLPSAGGRCVHGRGPAQAGCPCAQKHAPSSQGEGPIASRPSCCATGDAHAAPRSPMAQSPEHLASVAVAPARPVLASAGFVAGDQAARRPAPRGPPPARRFLENCTLLL
ncbi:MAG: hypothetical protein ACE37F_36015 [Nannocystaceae bacterium]|nr:hypothetical protein [bacterium]